MELGDDPNKPGVLREVCFDNVQLGMYCLCSCNNVSFYVKDEYLFKTKETLLKNKEDFEKLTVEETFAFFDKKLDDEDFDLDNIKSLVEELKPHQVKALAIALGEHLSYALSSLDDYYQEHNFN
jgi:hypothetical protein